MQGKYTQRIADKFEVVTVKTMEGIEDIRSIWEEMQAKQDYPIINADIDRYLSVIEAFSGDLQPYILLIKENNQPIAMLIGRIQKTRVKCAIGRRTLFAPLLKELCVVYGGLIGKDTNEICSLVVRELMRVLASGQADMVLLNHLPTDCRLFRLARRIPGPFCRGHFPKIEPHWSMSVPQNIDQFLQACSHNCRKNFRKHMRQIEKEFPGQVKMVTYSKEHELDLATKTVSGISANTYQRAFGAGFVDDFKMRTLLTAAATNGWLRVHILFVGDKPCAFSYVLKYGGTYFGELIGYHPEWKDFNVGTILDVKVLEQICGDPEVVRVDGGFGDGEHKRWGESKSWPEASVHIFAPQVFPVFVNMVRSSTLGISLVVQYLVTKLGVFNFVQRYRRRRVLRKSSKEQTAE